MNSQRQSVLEISKSAFRYNVKQIQNFVGKNIEIMPVIKASAYGTHINRKIELIKDFKIVAVAIVEEAVELRKIGFKNEIFVLNQPYVEDIPNIINYDVTIGVASTDFIKELVKCKEKVKIHIEIETGMGRTGVYLENINSIIDTIQMSNNITVEGVYTHLSSADIDEEYTNKQINIFQEATKRIKEKINTIKYVHCSASNGLLNFVNNGCNMVRPGIILYGYQASDTTMQKIDLKPVTRLKSKIAFIKDVEPGMSIGYGRTFISENRMKIATIGIGYADGIRRSLSNKGKVIINGKTANIVGKICMDSFMVDVTDIENVKIGDEVYLWDNRMITLEQVAEQCDTINYDILCTISNRVPREFID